MQETLAGNLIGWMVVLIALSALLLLLLLLWEQIKIVWLRLLPQHLQTAQSKMEEEVAPLPDTGDRRYYQRDQGERRG
jgi:hypothetical protein